jgi:LPS-assembly protein
VCLSAASIGTKSALAKEAVSESLSKQESVQWEITADRLTFLEKEGIYEAEGDVSISRPGESLFAEKAKYNEKTGIVEVSGGFFLKTKNETLSGEEAVFDLNRQTGKISKGRLFLVENNFTLSGDLFQKVGPESYVVKNCKVTSCAGEKPDWSFTGSEITVTIEGYGSVKHAAFRIRDVPIFYFPYALFPAKRERQSGILPPGLGYSAQTGFNVDVPIFWAISDQTDATFYERYMTKRGLMQGFEFRYLERPDSEGVFFFDILSDRIKEKDLTDPEQLEISPFPRTNAIRYWLFSRADQEFPWDLKTRLDLDIVSDQDFLREFQGNLYGGASRPDLEQQFGRPVEEIQSPTRRSALRLDRDGQLYSLQALGSFYEQPEDLEGEDIFQPYGGLAYDLLPRAIAKLPLFFRLNTDYDYVWHETKQNGHRASMTPALSYPIFLGRFLEIEPRVDGTLTAQWFEEDFQGMDRQLVERYRFRLRTSTQIERVFPIDWKGATGLKHRIRPSLIYTYNIPEEEVESPWFEPVIDDTRVNQIEFSLENVLDGKSRNKQGGASYAQWGTFNISQAYDMDEVIRKDIPDMERRPFKPLTGSMRVIAPNVDFLGNAGWDHYKSELTTVDLALGFMMDRSGGRKDRYSLDYLFVMDEVKSLSLDANINLAYGFAAGIAFQRDLILDKTNVSRYWLDYQGQCWGLRVTAERIDNVTGFLVEFNLLGLGKLGGLTFR